MKRLFMKNNVAKVKKTTINECMADMDMNGIRFEDSVSDKLVKNTEELHCHYSGLPSVLAYK